MSTIFYNIKRNVWTLVGCVLVQLAIIYLFSFKCFANETTSNYQAATQSEQVNKDVAKIIEDSKALEKQDDTIKSKSIVDERIANSKDPDNTTTDCEADIAHIISTSEKAIKTHGSSGMFKDLDANIAKPKSITDNKRKKEQYLSDEYSRYIFISSSLPKQALKEIFEAANRHNALIVLRGFKNNSYTETHKFFSKFIEEFKTGFVVDPGLFSRYAIESVPTYIMSLDQDTCTSIDCMTPIHDRVLGNVGINYAFKVLAKDGEIVSQGSATQTKEGGVQ